MQVQTEPRGPFHYSIAPIIICLVILAVCAIVILLTRKRPVKQVVKVPKKKEVSEIKQDYIGKIDALKKDIAAQTITNRKAFQSLSALIRNFIFEATNIKVQNYTLKQIEGLNMPSLTNLIREYYNPEFAQKSDGDIAESIEKTRGAIEQWH